jgi:hypothetical protein
MDIYPIKRKIVTLVEEAHEGTICIPNFQRDFVWRRDEVADLVRSILRGYFIGSLLLLRSDPNNPPFAPVYLRGSDPSLKTPQPKTLILDGQQRLSSLVYALTAPDLSLKDSSKRRWFFVDLDKLVADPDDDGIVFDRAKRELKGLDTQEVQFEQRILPCTALLSADAFNDWRDDYEDWAKAQGLEEQYREEWRRPWRATVTAFQLFEVPLIELPLIDESDSDAIGRVCAIFEKLNSTGVELSIYDLLTARLYRSEIRLHDLWASSCEEHQRLREWSNGKADEHKFGVLVLRTLALLRGLDPKPRILIDLSPADFEKDWNRAAKGVERALELLTHVGPDGFGVFGEKWIPGYGLIPILAALRTEIDERHLGDTERSELRRWYWCNVFLERYSSAVESKSRKDYLEMCNHWLAAGPEPDVFAEANTVIGSPGFRIRSSASHASAVYSGVFCLLAIRNARDWRRGENIQLQQLQDHHIMPQAYLKRHGITRRITINSIANRTLISDETNNKIKDKAPAVYLNNDEIIALANRAELLAPHFIDGNTMDVLLEAEEALDGPGAEGVHENFLQHREALIVDAIREACGVELSAFPIGVDSVDSEDQDELAGDLLLFDELEDASGAA